MSNRREMKKLREKQKRLRRILLVEVIVAVLALGAVAVFAILPAKDRGQKNPAGSTAAETAGNLTEEASDSTAADISVSETESTVQESVSDSTEETAGDTAASEDTGGQDQTSTEATETEETGASDSVQESEEGSADDVELDDQGLMTDYRHVVFIGDSRTLSMGTGGELAYDLVPMDSIAATWGGQLTDVSAYDNVTIAASRAPNKVVFWYGINDVQLSPERDSAENFINNYDRLLSAYLTMNDSSTIYLLSILPTTPQEKDYYEGQDANIEAYNKALQDYAVEKGYIYLDLSPLFTGDDCFAEGDNIHFSKAWYEERFIPAVTRALNIVY